VRFARGQIFLYQTIQWVVRVELAQAKVFFLNQEIFALCNFLSHYSSSWVSMGPAMVFFQETPAKYQTLAVHKNEYYPQISQQVEEF
jgi:hypothetical protein